MVLTQVPPVEHFFESITRWFGQEGGDLDSNTGQVVAELKVVTSNKLCESIL